MTQVIVEVVNTSKKKQKSVLAKNIIAGRESLGFTAEKFAEEAKIPYPTLRDIEADLSGGRKVTLEKIAKALGVEEWQLKKPDLFSSNSLIESNGSNSPSGYAQKYNHPHNQVYNGHEGDSHKWNDKNTNPEGLNPVANNKSRDKAADAIDKVGHVPSSDSNQNNFSDRATLILEIQDLLRDLPESDLETVRFTALNLAQLSQNKNLNKQAKD